MSAQDVPFSVCTLAKPDITLASDGSGHDSIMTSNYDSMKDLWKSVVPSTANPDSVWYDKSLKYWAEQTDDISGVMGGFPELHVVDMRNAKAVLAILQHKFGMKLENSIDCGAGVGRVADALLTPICSERLHILEPVPKLLLRAFLTYRTKYETATDSPAGDPADAATKDDLVPWREFEVPVGDGDKVPVRILPDVQVTNGPAVSFYGVPIQRFVPSVRYDLVVMQWVSLYLLDHDFVATIARFVGSLTRPTGDDSRWGFVYLKDNFLVRDSFLYDRDDSSVTRSVGHVLRLCEKANVKCVLIHEEQEWPTNMLPAFTFILTHADAPFPSVSIAVEKPKAKPKGKSKRK